MAMRPAGQRFNGRLPLRRRRLQKITRELLSVCTFGLCRTFTVQGGCRMLDVLLRRFNAYAPTVGTNFVKEKEHHDYLR